jgi:hypothetical protein
VDNFDRFWVWIWSIIGIAFIAFVGTVGGCTMQQQKLIAESPDPVAVSCAMNAGREPCMAVILREKH